MVDFTTPNLCGASEEFNKLASQFSSIKDSLQGSLEGEIDALKSELTASLACLLYTSPSPRDRTRSRMPSSA